MTISNQIKQTVTERRDLVFLRREFNIFGRPRSVNRALSQLIVDGVLIRLGVGIYAKTKRSVLTGNIIPAQPLEVLGPQALEKLGIKAAPSRLTVRYNSGQSTQVPVGLMVNVGQQRVSRKIGFNDNYLSYERG
jgi:hypothetical protein